MKGDPKLDDDDDGWEGTDLEKCRQECLPPIQFQRGGKRWWGGEPLWQARRACVYF